MSVPVITRDHYIQLVCAQISGTLANPANASSIDSPYARQIMLGEAIDDVDEMLKTKHINIELE